MTRSYDIFDTCLTRRVGEPAGVFDLMAGRHGLGSDFRFHRQEAEREAERRIPNATLEEIYAVLGEWSGWGVERRQEVMDAELSEETRQLIPVPEMLEQVRDFRSKGGRVMFLSDMYLPSSFLTGRLREHGFYEEGDVLMVSCEHRKSKADGRLFLEAVARSGVTRWEHIGNHLTTDVSRAEKAGLVGTHFTRANLTPHETRLLDWSLGGASIGAAWAGAARQARIALGRLSDEEHAVASVAAGVAAPLLLTYMSWLVDRAMHHGLDTLCFLARDGQILRDLFVRIAKAKGCRTEARYLYASRISLRFPREFPMSDKEAAGLFQAGGALPISVIALRLGISEDELRRLLPKDCVTRGKVAKNRVAACRDALASPEACRILKAVAARRGELLEAYLRQEGLMDQGKTGLVDLGWSGSIQAGINRALTAAGHDVPIPAFYLGLNGLPSEDIPAEAFAFDFRTGPTTDVQWFNLMAELFAQADHGSTLGFGRTAGGDIEPVLDVPDGDNPVVPDWLDLHRRSVLGFADAVIEDGALPGNPGSLVRLLRGQLRQFCFHPSRQEAAVWGSSTFSSHGAAAVREPIAPPPSSFRDVVWILGIRWFGAGSAIWPHGAAARLPKPLHHIAKVAHKVMSRLRPLRW